MRNLLYLAFYALACHATECIEDERNTLDASQKVILHLKSDMAVGKYAEDLGTASHKARLLSAAVSSLRWNAFERKVCILLCLGFPGRRIEGFRGGELRVSPPGWWWC
jgi:hypothetical protein